MTTTLKPLCEDCRHLLHILYWFSPSLLGNVCESCLTLLWAFVLARWFFWNALKQYWESMYTTVVSLISDTSMVRSDRVSLQVSIQCHYYWNALISLYYHAFYKYRQVDNYSIMLSSTYLTIIRLLKSTWWYVLIICITSCYSPHIRLLASRSNWKLHFLVLPIFNLI